MGQQALLVLVLMELLEYKDQQVQQVSLGLAELPEPLELALMGQQVLRELQEPPVLVLLEPQEPQA